MKNFILHIGLPKTGSTTLQNHYFAKLKHPQICYNPPLIVEALKEALKLLDFECLTNKNITLLKRIITSQSNKISQNNILISLETLSQRLMRFNPLERARFLHFIFPSATVFLILRYQPSLLRSLYQEHVSQNYILSPEEVFVPFNTMIFKGKNYWKSKMQIDIKEWNYTKTIHHFKRYYGENIHVLFFEDFVDNLLKLGDKILESGCSSNIKISSKLSNNYFPKENISYNLTTMNILFSIINYKTLLRENIGYNCLYMQNLMEQYQQAHYIFDASSKDDFLRRIRKKQASSSGTYKRIDKFLIKHLKRYNKLQSKIRPIRYRLPIPIQDYIEKESKRMNASLVEIFNRNTIPTQYF